MPRCGYEKKWAVTRHFLQSGARLKLRRTVYCSLVSSVLQSGLECQIVTKPMWDSIDKIFHQHTRTMLRGAACSWTVGRKLNNAGNEEITKTKPIALKNVAVARRVGLVPPSIDAIGRRIRWYQSLMRWPARNSLTIGLFHAEINEEARSNPWRRQLVRDIMLMSMFEGCEGLPDCVGDDIRNLLLEGNELEWNCFIKFDVRVLASAYWKECMPKIDLPEEGDARAERLECVCTILDENGVQCGKKMQESGCAIVTPTNVKQLQPCGAM